MSELNFKLPDLDKPASSKSKEHDSNNHKKKKIKKRKRESSSSSLERSLRKRKKRKKEKHKKKKKKEKKRKEVVAPVCHEVPTKIIPPPPAIACVPIGPTESSQRSLSMRPMTRDEWEQRQSVTRHVYDPNTGRTRLIKGDGEILEEIVTRERHREINKHATQMDGAVFQSKALPRVRD